MLKVGGADGKSVNLEITRWSIILEPVSKSALESPRISTHRYTWTALPSHRGLEVDCSWTSWVSKQWAQYAQIQLKVIPIPGFLDK